MQKEIDDGTQEPDIVLVVLQRVMAVIPALTAETARQIEQGLRAEYGGLRVRIPKRKKWLDPDARSRVMTDAMTGATDSEIVNRHGISRRTLYNMVKRGIP